MAGYVPLPVIQKEAWAQCENPNCQKWRKLPPGAPEINEDEPWYCYLNPDAARNTCSASEVDYDENNEIVIAGMDDPEEAARNRAIMEDLEASIAAAAAAAAARGRGKGRGGARGRGRGARGRGRPPLPGGGAVAGRAFGALPTFNFGYAGGAGAGAGGGGSRRMRNVSFAEDYDIEAGDSDLTGRHASRITKRQIAKHLQRLVENYGQWDAPRGGAQPAPSVIPPSLPSEAWEALANAAPETAELACAAADLASSVRYFETSAAGGNGGHAEDAVTEAGNLARIGTVLAATSGLVDCQDALKKVERDRLGLDDAAAVQLPDPTVPLNFANYGGNDNAVAGGIVAEAFPTNEEIAADGPIEPEGDEHMMDAEMVQQQQQELRPDGVMQGVV